MTARQKLTARETAFVQAYLQTANAAQAARQAGYSERSAKQRGLELVRRPTVAAALEDALKARAQRAGIESDIVLQRLVEYCDADLADIFDDDGCLKPVDEWPTIWRQGLVKSWKFEETFRTDANGNRVLVSRSLSIRFSDRVRHLELLGRHISVSAFREPAKRTEEGKSALRRLMEQIGGRAISPRET